MDVDAVVTAALDRLRAGASPDRAVHEKGYLRSDLEFLGASVPDVRRLARDVCREHADLDHDGLRRMVARCWDEGVHELRLLAVELLVQRSELLSPADADLVAQLCREARTWALVDPLAIGVGGDLTARFPDAMDEVVRAWAIDPDLWVRRASLLAHLHAVRGGDDEGLGRFGELADGMLEEQEFFIRKAIGWVLREAGRRRPDVIAAWVRPRVGRMAGLTLREAVKHLPETDRLELLSLAADVGGTRQRTPHRGA